MRRILFVKTAESDILLWMPTVAEFNGLGKKNFNHLFKGASLNIDNIFYSIMEIDQSSSAEYIIVTLKTIELNQRVAILDDNV